MLFSQKCPKDLMYQGKDARRYIRFKIKGDEKGEAPCLIMPKKDFCLDEFCSIEEIGSLDIDKSIEARAIDWSQGGIGAKSRTQLATGEAYVIILFDDDPNARYEDNNLRIKIIEATAVHSKKQEDNYRVGFHAHKPIIGSGDDTCILGMKH